MIRGPHLILARIRKWRLSSSLPIWVVSGPRLEKSFGVNEIEIFGATEEGGVSIRHLRSAKTMLHQVQAKYVTMDAADKAASMKRGLRRNLPAGRNAPMLGCLSRPPFFPGPVGSMTCRGLCSACDASGWMQGAAQSAVLLRRPLVRPEYVGARLPGPSPGFRVSLT